MTDKSVLNGKIAQGYEHQADAAISQANPVSTTLYTVLDTTKNVRIISIEAMITWAVDQPSPLEVVVTVDGVSIIFNRDNPVTATEYFGEWYGNKAGGDLIAFAAGTTARPFLLEGRSIKVQIRVTWAGTQPTPLVCRVKWAKIP